jgi:hypothetical protein
MNKKNINIILSVLCFIGFLITNWYGLTFLAGAFFGEYIIARFNLFETDEVLEDSWVSQFEVNRFDEDNHKSR